MNFASGVDHLFSYMNNYRKLFHKSDRSFAKKTMPFGKLGHRNQAENKIYVAEMIKLAFLF